MKAYFAYIRVSTAKQGERGSSLQEQKSAIEAYAQRNGLKLVRWFEERETAAKQGRRMFNELLSDLDRGAAQGVVMHKIDRSARNLRDWAQLGDLIDAGVDVRFVHENVDFGSRGGRLSADIQAVVAADYIRNLRDEVKKGFYGRLKQGFYPLPAPRGYLDRGKAKAKAIDPVAGPLIRQMFELYATGEYSITNLLGEMHKRGLTRRSGAPLSRGSFAEILHNPFYTGIIHIRRTGDTFEGCHEPIISKRLFDQVQAVSAGRSFARPTKHNFIFRRLIHCASCKYSLVGEARKGHTYYRCHTPACRGTILREPDVDDAVADCLGLLHFPDPEFGDLGDLIDDMQTSDADDYAARLSHLQRDLGLCEDRLQRLTDTYVDGLLDRHAFESRRATLLVEKCDLQRALDEADSSEPFSVQVRKNLGRANSAQLHYQMGIPAEKRALVKELTSDLLASGKNLEIRLRTPFCEIAQWRLEHNGGPYQARPRTGVTRCNGHHKLIGALRAVLESSAKSPTSSLSSHKLAA